MALRPRDANAALGLLRNIPKWDCDQTELLRLAGSIFEDETDSDIIAVGRAYWHLSENLARALRLHPEFLAAFIQYGQIAILTPNDPYPSLVSRICRADPSRFERAFKSLPDKDQRYISSVIIQPQGCKQIAVPEAD
ncbi:MAG TPA: hypothetical protein VE996_03270 [Terriglobales bacterium]|nr:hypothetical protein [Terriglobales bacterium]